MDTSLQADPHNTSGCKRRGVRRVEGKQSDELIVLFSFLVLFPFIHLSLHPLACSSYLFISLPLEGCDNRYHGEVVVVEGKRERKERERWVTRKAKKRAARVEGVEPHILLISVSIVISDRTALLGACQPRCGEGPSIILSSVFTLPNSLFFPFLPFISQRKLFSIFQADCRTLSA